MQEQDKTMLGRRRWLLGSLGAVAAGAAVVSTSNNAAQSSPAAEFAPAQHSKDAWMGELPSVHRVFIDTAAAEGGLTAMNYANNILTVHVQDYGGSESDYALLLCFRHQTTPLGYNDAMWAKYGESFSGFMRLSDPRTDMPYMANPLGMPGRSDLPSRGHTLQEMAERGVHYVICDRATRGLSGFLARSVGADADEVYKELVANLVVRGRLVPAGVMAATRAQEYGYSLLSAG